MINLFSKKSLTPDEKHFIYMCGIAGQIFGCKFIPDKHNGDSIRKKYSDPVYMAGYEKIIEDKLYKERRTW